MSISKWAEQYCTQSSELMMLYQPEQGYICQSIGLIRVLSHSSTDISKFFSKLTPEQYSHPNFDAFSIKLEECSYIDNLYCYQFSQLKSDEKSWKSFADTMAKLHQLMFRISQVKTLDELYQQAILELRNQTHQLKCGLPR